MKAYSQFILLSLLMLLIGSMAMKCAESIRLQRKAKATRNSLNTTTPCVKSDCEIWFEGVLGEKFPLGQPPCDTPSDCERFADEYGIAKADFAKVKIPARPARQSADPAGQSAMDDYIAHLIGDDAKQAPVVKEPIKQPSRVQKKLDPCDDAECDHYFKHILGDGVCDTTPCERELARRRATEQANERAANERRKAANLEEAMKCENLVKNSRKAKRANHGDCKCDSPRQIFPTGCIPRKENGSVMYSMEHTSREWLYPRLQALKAEDFWDEWEDRNIDYMCFCLTDDEWQEMIGMPRHRPNRNPKLRDFYFEEKDVYYGGKHEVLTSRSWFGFTSGISKDTHFNKAVPEWRKLEECEKSYATKKRMLFALWRDARDVLPRRLESTNGALPFSLALSFTTNSYDDVVTIKAEISKHVSDDDRETVLLERARGSKATFPLKVKDLYAAKPETMEVKTAGKSNPESRVRVDCQSVSGDIVKAYYLQIKLSFDLEYFDRSPGVYSETIVSDDKLDISITLDGNDLKWERHSSAAIKWGRKSAKMQPKWGRYD